MWKFGDAITAPTSPKIKYNVFVLEGRYRDLIPVCIGAMLPVVSSLCRCWVCICCVENDTIWLNRFFNFPLRIFGFKLLYKGGTLSVSMLLR